MNPGEEGTVLFFPFVTGNPALNFSFPIIPFPQIYPNHPEVDKRQNACNTIGKYQLPEVEGVEILYAAICLCEFINTWIALKV